MNRMDILTALHILRASGARLEPAPGRRITIANPQHIPVAALRSLAAHKAHLLPMVYGASSCYVPGHLLPLELADAKTMAIYHYPLPGGIGIAQRKGEDAWTWYVQNSPAALAEEGTADQFMARLEELGVRDHGEGEVSNE